MNKQMPVDTHMCAHWHARVQMCVRSHMHICINKCSVLVSWHACVLARVCEHVHTHRPTAQHTDSWACTYTHRTATLLLLLSSFWHTGRYAMTSGSPVKPQCFSTQVLCPAGLA